MKPIKVFLTEPNDVAKQFWQIHGGFKDVYTGNPDGETTPILICPHNVLPKRFEYFFELLEDEPDDIFITFAVKDAFFYAGIPNSKNRKTVELTDWTYSNRLTYGNLFFSNIQVKQRIAIYCTIKHAQSAEQKVTAHFDLHKLRSQMEMYAYHINNFLKDEFELIFKPLPSRREILIKLRKKEPFDIAWANHAIICEQRGVKAKGEEFYQALRKKTSGLITTFCGSHTNVNKEDVLFYSLPSGKARKKHCRLVNWAAEPSILYPEQPNNEIRVLVDHPYYGQNRISILDQTKNTVNSFIDFQTANPHLNLKGRKFVSGDVVDIVDKDVPRYLHVNLNYKDTCQEYRRSHVFVVTHLESMGLSVLESAMCGALIVVPVSNGESYIKGCLIKHLHHIKYDVKDGIDWQAVIDKIDVKKAQKMASRYTWEKTTNKIRDTFEKWHKYKYENNLVFRNSH